MSIMDQEVDQLGDDISQFDDEIVEWHFEHMKILKVPKNTH